MDRLLLPWGLSRPNPIHQELLGAKVSANKAGCFLPGLPHCIPRCQLCFRPFPVRLPRELEGSAKWARDQPSQLLVLLPSAACYTLHTIQRLLGPGGLGSPWNTGDRKARLL